MKKFMITAICLIAAIAIATPALATDVSFKGQLRTRGYSDSNISMDERSDNSNAWMDMRFRLKTVFKISDALSVTTRFDALDDQAWGQVAGSPVSNGNLDSINFDRAYMTIKTDFGKFDIGRMMGFVWGHTFMDAEADVDRIKYTLPIGDFVLIAIFQKNAEVDAGIKYSDTDNETYYLAGLYKSEMFTGGLLAGYTQSRTASDDPATLGVFQNPRAQAAYQRDPLVAPYIAQYNSFDSTIWLLDPYFTLKIADVTVKGEAQVRFGQMMEFDRAYFNAPNTYPGTAANPVTINGVEYKGGRFKDIDIEAWAWNLEAGYEIGPLNFEIGYAWSQGQGYEGAFDANGLPSRKDPKIRTIGGIGTDWDKLWILTATEDGLMSGGLGNAGNLSGGIAGQAGAKIFYLGAGFKPMENLSLNVTYGNAKAEAPTIKNQSKDFGNEYDFKLVWDIMDNLSYTFIAAYLDAGDYWQDTIFMTQPGTDSKGNPLTSKNQIKLDNNYSLFNEIKITF